MDNHQPIKSVFIYPWETELIRKTILHKQQSNKYYCAVDAGLGQCLVKGYSPADVAVFIVNDEERKRAQCPVQLEEFYLMWRRSILRSIASFSRTIAVFCSESVAQEMYNCFDPCIDHVHATIFKPDPNGTEWNFICVEVRFMGNYCDIFNFSFVERHERIFLS